MNAFLSCYISPEYSAFDSYCTYISIVASSDEVKGTMLMGDSVTNQPNLWKSNPNSLEAKRTQYSTRHLLWGSARRRCAVQLYPRKSESKIGSCKVKIKKNGKVLGPEAWHPLFIAPRPRLAFHYHSLILRWDLSLTPRYAWYFRVHRCQFEILKL